MNERIYMSGRTFEVKNVVEIHNHVITDDLTKRGMEPRIYVAKTFDGSNVEAQFLRDSKTGSFERMEF